jgi:hypothetical protein
MPNDSTYKEWLDRGQPDWTNDEWWTVPRF